MSKEQEKKFLDRESLKQAFVLIKAFARDNFVSKADYQSGSTTSDQALADAKTELNGTITATKAEIEADLETTQSALEAADTALGERIDSLTTTLNTAKIKFAIVDALPDAEKADERTIYLIKNEEAGRTDDEKNIYIEYMFIDGKFEEIGDTQISLEDYSTTSEVDAKVEVVKEEALTAVTELSATIEENNYVMTENSITTAEVQALFLEEPVMVDADGKISNISDIAVALESATAGTTIVLGKNVSVAAGTEIAEGITIDLNGFTMEVAE